MQRIFEWITGHRRGVVTAGAIVVLAAALAARDLELDYSVEQFFPTWGDERAVFDDYRQIFAQEDAQVAFFLDTPRRLDASAYATLRAVAGAFEREGLDDVWWAGRIGDVARAASDPLALDSVSTALRADPLFTSVLWSPDGAVHTVQAVLPPARNNDAERRRVASTLDREITALEIEARWTLTGTPMLRAQVPELLERDQSVLLGGGIVLFFVVLYAFVGHAGRALLALAAVLPAYVATLALMAVLGRPVTIMSSFIPIVVLVVGVCDSTHLLVHWGRHRGRGMTAPAAAVATFTELASSCFFTSLTTALGFLSLVATGIGVIADFGTFTAFAVMATFAFTMSLLPALLAFGGGTAPRAPRLPSLLVRPVVGWAWAAQRRGSIRPLAAFALVSAVCLAAGRGIPIDTYLVDDLKEDTRIIQDLRWIERSGFALFQTNVFLRADGRELAAPGMLAWMERFQRAVEREPIVASTFALPDLLGAAASGAARTSPGDVDRLARAVYRPEAGAAQIVVTVQDAGSLRTLPFLIRVEEMLDADPPPSGTAHVTGTVLMAHTFSSHVLRSFAPSIVLALVMIWLVMTGLFRSVRLGLVALVPNLFPLVVLVGVMGALDIPLKPSSILVFSIAFGIAVDDSIHLMGRFRHLMGRGWDRRRAIRRALCETGPALVMSTVVVSAGFGLLLMSRFELLHLVGLLTATTAVAALAADLFVFPALLGVEGSSRSGRGAPALHATDPSGRRPLTAPPRTMASTEGARTSGAFRSVPSARAP